ncbi:N/A [soil metagenome]
MIDELKTIQLPRSPWWASLLVALAVLISVAPTLGRLEFSSSMENLNVATVLEMSRTTMWLIPTLEGDMRLNKPPLTAWVTWQFVPDSLVARLDQPDAAGRAESYRELAFRIRLAPLLETCLTILLIAATARLAFGAPAGVLAAAAYASSILVLKLGRFATTDVQMTLWIALAQYGVALASFRNQRWPGCLVAGAATGLALMSKGPVCLLFIVLPWIAFALVSIRQAVGDTATNSPAAPVVRGIGERLAPILAGAVAAILVGVPWFIFVYLQSPGVVRGWTTEVTRVGATENSSSDPIFYLAIFPCITPWMPWAIVGIVRAVRDLRRRLSTPAVWLLLALVLPLIVMSFFPDRKDSYMLPAMIPMAMLTAYGILQLLPMPADALGTFRTSKLWRVLVRIQFITLALIAIGFTVAGATFLRTIDNQPWHSATVAAVVSVAMIVLLQAGYFLQQRRPLAFVGVSLVVMLSMQALGMHGYARSKAGRSELRPLAEAIRTAYPKPGQIINGRERKRVSVDLAIYLNRPTQRVPDWQSRLPSDPPAIAIVPQQGGSPDPIPPPGWHALSKVPRDDNWMWAFVQSEK